MGETSIDEITKKLHDGLNQDVTALKQLGTIFSDFQIEIEKFKKLIFVNSNNYRKRHGLPMRRKVR